MEDEKNSFLWGILGFFVPIVGLILFILWNNTKKKSAKAAGLGALIRVIVTIFFVILFFIFFAFAIVTGERIIDDDCDPFDEDCTVERYESINYNTNEIKLFVNEKEYIVTLEDNSTARALLKKLRSGDVHVKAIDNSNFEKVGSLDFDLPSNDNYITTEVGDLILYQSNKLCLYYDVNSYNLTKIGHINNINPDEFRSVLGQGEVEFTLSIMYK